jgi:hypothetical protein
MLSELYSANNIVGKTLIAKKTLNAYSLPLDNDPNRKLLFTISPGSVVGVVDTFFNPKENRKNLWWGFYTNVSGSKKFYYVEHLPGNFDLTALIKQGVPTTEQETEKNKTWEEQLADLLKKGGTFLKYAAIFGAGAIILNIILKNRRSNEGGNR